MTQFSEEAKIELYKRELASRKLDYFVKYCFNGYEMVATQRGKGVHKQIIDKLEAVERGEIKRLMIFCPPRLGKSTLVSQYFPTRYLGRHQERNIILASYGADLAGDFGRKARYIVNSPEYRNVFDLQLARDKSEASNRETNKGGGYYTVGIGGAITGKGGDLLIIDDPVKDKQEAKSEAIQTRNIDWYKDVLYTRRQNQDSAIIIMMTRWDTGDLSGYLIDEEKAGGEKWDKLIIQAIDEKDFEIIRPGKRDAGYFRSVRDTIGNKEFQALYQQDPVKASGRIFNQSDFRYFLESDFDTKYNKSDLSCGIFIDPAFSSRKESDDACVILAGKHKLTNDIYILDIYADTSSPTNTFSAILTMTEKRKHKGFGIDFISVEQVSLNKDQSKFYIDLIEFMRVNDKHYVINEYRPKEKKEDRIKFQIEPRLSMHSLLFRGDPENKEPRKRLERQLLEFPDGHRDDVVDTVAQVIHVFSIRSEKKTDGIQKVIRDPITMKVLNKDDPRQAFIKRMGIKFV